MYQSTKKNASRQKKNKDIDMNQNVMKEDKNTYTRIFTPHDTSSTAIMFQDIQNQYDNIVSIDNDAFEAYVHINTIICNCKQFQSLKPFFNTDTYKEITCLSEKCDYKEVVQDQSNGSVWPIYKFERNKLLLYSTYTSTSK